jgi:DNA (cytosine-5)-methyltransferase 1
MSAIPSYNVIDLFSGVGGISVGFRDCSEEPRCQLQIRLMVDNDKEAFTVAARNMPDVPFLVADMHDVSAADLRRHARMSSQEAVHVLVGGPPCQGFSFLGKRMLADPRNIHLIDFLRLVKELKPWVALMENVPLIKTSHNGAIIREVEASLSELGYAYVSIVLQASDYGVPQSRRRAFVLAYRKDLGVPPQFPSRSHERIPEALELIKNGDNRLRYEAHKLPYISVGEAIGDLPQLNAGEGNEILFYKSEPISDFQRWARNGSLAIFNHRSRAHGKAYLEKISVIEEGGRNTELPKDKRFSETYYSQAYARLHRNGIAQTVTTCFGNPGSGRFLHYRDLRSITVREAARLQSFPDWFSFEGTLSTQMRLVGNAVPPLLARAIRDQVARDLLGADQLRQRVTQTIAPNPTKEDPEVRSHTGRVVLSKKMARQKNSWVDSGSGSFPSV